MADSLRAPLSRAVLAVALILSASGVRWVDPDRTAQVVRSVVRIVNFQQIPDWFSPWDAGPVRQISGSSFVIAGGLILTNAHVVSDSKLLMLVLNGDPEPHPAEVVFVAHDCDLALVRPKDPRLLTHVPALELGGLPKLGSSVETIGYPAGGTEVSSTRGVVSRVEVQGYAHSGADRHLIGQTDAAINPGNSGGPVVQDGVVVGVAFQAAAGLENVGYFIPTEVVYRFLDDIKDGRYDGYPELGLRAVNLENPAARRKAAMGDAETGVRVEGVLPGSSAQGLVRPGDVLLAVDGRIVANDGSVADDGFRLPFGMLIDRKLVGEAVKLRLLRDGSRVDVRVRLTDYQPAHWHANAHDRQPRYFVYGGLVFVPLELETVKTFGDRWAREGDKAFLYEFLFRPEAEPERLREERVVLLRRLDHPVNASIAWFKNMVVERVNGRRVTSLEDLIKAIDENTGHHDVIEFSDYRRTAVLDRAEVAGANSEILERYGIAKDRRL
jgi:S1-C subfamily serine protease